MKNRLQVMVAENESEHLESLKAFLEEQEEISEVMTSYDGNELYEMIDRNCPDVVILEDCLNGMSGIEILEQLKNEKKAEHIFFIMLSSDGSDEVVHRAGKLGASYYVMKPFQPGNLYRHIKRRYDKNHSFLAEENFFGKSNREEAKEALENEVTALIRELGIPAHIKGYHYIRDSIILAVNDGHVLNYITKLLYPTIAKKYKTTSSSVERAIRHAIEVAFSRGKADLLQELFGPSFYVGRGKPTNSEFIALITDKLQLRFKTE